MTAERHSRRLREGAPCSPGWPEADDCTLAFFTLSQINTFTGGHGTDQVTIITSTGTAPALSLIETGTGGVGTDVVSPGMGGSTLLLKFTGWEPPCEPCRGHPENSDQKLLFFATTKCLVY